MCGGVGVGEGITRLNALVHLPEFVLDEQEIRSLSCSHILKSPHDVVISLDNALRDVTCAHYRSGVHLMRRPGRYTV